MLQGALIGLVVALVMMFLQRRNAKKGTGIAGDLDRVLAERGALTLQEAAAAVGKDTFMGRGEVAQSLNALSSVGKVRILPAPDGTPQLKKVDLIRYERIVG
jgi:hypothetical protein